MNPTGLGEALQSIEEEEREGLYRQYVPLLMTDALDPKARATLRDLMKRLGKTPADVQADAVTLQRAMVAVAKIDDGEAVRDEAPKSQTALLAAADKLAETIQRLQAEYQRQHFANDEIQRRSLQGQGAAHDLAAMVAREPLLLAHIASKARIAR